MRGNGFRHARNVDRVLCSFRINDTVTLSKLFDFFIYLFFFPPDSALAGICLQNILHLQVSSL